MIQKFKNNLPKYLIEAWALGIFMISCCGFDILIEHPDLGIKTYFTSNIFRRFLMGIAMGITAVYLLKSAWGKKSGAHMNPAVTLANYFMHKITAFNAFFYILFQFIGGTLGVYLFKILMPDFISSKYVNYVVTIPLHSLIHPVFVAFVCEFLISFILFAAILWMARKPKTKRNIPYMVGFLLLIYITFEAPYSGMSINPARTVASALPANNYDAIWLYFVAPTLGMLLAAKILKPVKKLKTIENLQKL